MYINVLYNLSIVVSNRNANKLFLIIVVEVGASSHPCSNIYSGTGPFSEPETQAIRDYIKTTISDVQLDVFVNVNSYGQTWLFPWTFDPEEIKNEDTVASTKRVASTLMIFLFYGSLVLKHTSDCCLGQDAVTMHDLRHVFANSNCMR